MRVKMGECCRKIQRSGGFVGSIGAGGFEIRPNGKFYKHHIFNEWKLETPFDAFFLYKNKNITRVLWTEEFSTYGKIITGVKKIVYTAHFPKLTLHYPEINVTVEFTSFFIPGDTKNSSLPSIKFKVKGEGQLIFIMPSDFKSKPVLKKRNIILKSKEGEIGLYTGNGNTFCFPKKYNILIHFEKGINPKEYQFFPHIDDFVAGILWQGDFDDEVILSWYYPDMKDFDNNFIGHYYSNFFNSYNDVLNYVLKNKKELEVKTEKFYRKIHKSRLPTFLKEGYTAQLFTLIKQSWFTKKSEFGVWEGSTCCCGLQTTDVAYYGSWLYLNLFPELEKNGISLTAKFQNKAGWIPHFFPGTFKRIDEYRRKDMNMQFVLMVYRDYYYWNDKDFLKEMYYKIKKSIALVYTWDSDGDLIPEIEGPDQTFDVWGWKGCSIYLASLWLATLRAGMEIGKLMEDKKFADECEKSFRIVKENIIKKLWNGEYFILWTDGKIKDEGCLLDGLSGDWYCYLTGLGHILPENMIKSHLKACLKYNRKKIDYSYMKMYYTPDEKGWCYINGGYKDNRKFCYQQFEPWTGMEYAFALHLYIMGMKKAALRVIKDVHRRKRECGMVWNHIECGGNYYRPFVIGALWDLICKEKKR